MEFALHYRGPLSPKANAADKLSIRRHFHAQVKKICTDEDSPVRHNPRNWLLEVRKKIGDFEFVALVAGWNGLLAEVEIILLRPEAPGSIVSSGDIDNRLKTLFDAIKIPQHLQDLPPGATPAEGETPFFCILEDDRRITKVTIQTERLWEAASSDEVELIMLVRPVSMYGGFT